MFHYVYICTDAEQLSITQNFVMKMGFLSKNLKWEKMISCLACVLYPENDPKNPQYLGKTKKTIAAEANRLLRDGFNGKLPNNSYIVRPYVSKKQVGKMMKPHKGKLSVYSCIILMAIYNLLYDETHCSLPPQLIDYVQRRALSDTAFQSLSYVDFGTDEQYTDIGKAYEAGCGQFGKTGSHQCRLAGYFLECGRIITQRHDEKSFLYVLKNGRMFPVFRPEDIPSMDDHLSV